MTKDPSDKVIDLLVDWPCDLCGSTALRTIRPAQYSGDETVSTLLATYSSSSESPLRDRLTQSRRCGLTFDSPRLLDSLMLRGYAEAVDPRHFAQARFRESSFGRALDRLMHDQPWMRPKRGAKLLDIGCAGGSFLSAARERGFDAAGVEPATWLAEQGAAHYGLEITAGYFEPKSYGEAAFDVVSMWDVLEHVPSPMELLVGVHEVLKPGGAIIINVPMIDSLTARVLGSRWPFYLDVHLYYFTLATLSRYLESTGFALVGQRSYWQTLPLGYLAERALGRRLDPARVPRGLRNVPIRYNMGQRTIVGRRR